MKILNSTGWSTESLRALVDRAEAEAKQPNASRYTREFEDIHFKPTSHHVAVRVSADIYRSKTITVHMWQPVKFKNKLDELTKIAASTDTYELGREHAARLFVELKVAFGVDYSKGVHYRGGVEDGIKEETNPPVIVERHPEEGRREDAQIKLEATIVERAKARQKFEENDKAFAARIEELKRSIDFNTKKLEKMAKEKAVIK